LRAILGQSGLENVDTTTTRKKLADQSVSVGHTSLSSHTLDIVILTSDYKGKPHAKTE
jgi:hypothetical protein